MNNERRNDGRRAMSVGCQTDFILSDVHELESTSKKVEDLEIALAAARMEVEAIQTRQPCFTTTLRSTLLRLFFLSTVHCQRIGL